MKRRASSSSSPSTQTAEGAKPKPKKTRKPPTSLPTDYHATPSVRDENGEIVWPAPADQIQRAKQIILECASAGKRTLLVPDKDADGLSAGAILRHTLILLGLDPELISAHFVRKDSNVHDSVERDAMAAYSPDYLFVLDQGSRRSGPIINDMSGPDRTLIIDHHWVSPSSSSTTSPSPSSFPENSTFITACRSPPIATTSLLTYHICTSLLRNHHSSTIDSNPTHPLHWLCALGIHGDLGSSPSIKFLPPFPDLSPTFALPGHSRTSIISAVSLINAPRRTRSADPSIAWQALTTSPSSSSSSSSTVTPRNILDHFPALQAAKYQVRNETDRWGRAPPKFSADGKWAVVRIRSGCQVHPVIATRWAGTLGARDKGGKLKVVMCANEGYIEGKVNFSCRIANNKSRQEDGEGEVEVDIIAMLEDVVAKKGNNGRTTPHGRDSEDGGDESRAAAANTAAKAGGGDDDGHHGGGKNEQDDDGDARPLRERLGDSFARGHKQASGGVVGTREFEELMEIMEVGKKKESKMKKKADRESSPQKNTLMNYFSKG